MCRVRPTFGSEMGQVHHILVLAFERPDDAKEHGPQHNDEQGHRKEQELGVAPQEEQQRGGWGGALREGEGEGEGEVRERGCGREGERGGVLACILHAGGFPYG